VRRATAPAVATALAVAIVAALAVIGIPRIPAVWGFVWGTADSLTGGVEERHERLVKSPFPAALTPPGYRLDEVEEMVDPEGVRQGVRVLFAGPDDENSISYYPHAMVASEVLDYWTRQDDVFGLDAVVVEDLGEHSSCHEGDDVFHETHGVTCIAAFDGMAIITDSVNTKPGHGNVRHSVTLLRAGVEYWESVRG